MRHYTLYKFAKGTNLDEAGKKICEAFNELAKQLPWLSNPAIYKNCITRTFNADLMATFEIDSPAHLNSYLRHKIHEELIRSFGNSLLDRMSFDRLDEVINNE